VVQYTHLMALFFHTFYSCKTCKVLRCYLIWEKSVRLLMGQLAGLVGGRPKVFLEDPQDPVRSEASLKMNWHSSREFGEMTAMPYYKGMRVICMSWSHVCHMGGSLPCRLYSMSGRLMIPRRVPENSPQNPREPSSFK
jgi:hypothetical protein